MAYGLYAYVGGNEIVYSSTPFNLYHSLKLTNLTAGTHTITLDNPNPINGSIQFTGESSTTEDQIVSLGGPVEAAYSVTDAHISGKVFSITLVKNTSTPGAASLSFSFYVTRL